MAYPSVVILDPASPETNDALMVKRLNGYTDVQVAIANPGTNTNQPNVLCLRNAVQVKCTPDVDVWEVTVFPHVKCYRRLYGSLN